MNAIDRFWAKHGAAETPSEMSDDDVKKKLVAFLKKHAVLVAAAVCAAASAFIVPPDETYFSYLDLRVLCLLFSLMVVVAGLQSCNVFAVLSQKLLQGKRNLRALVLLLVLLPFFSSMLITNDVALITFVPFAILVLSLLRERRHLIKVIVLQTVAANLGSMATPFGNPQNLYLYTTFSISPLDFLLIMGKFTGCSLLLLLLCGFLFPKETRTVRFPQKAAVSSRLDVTLYGMLFVCCLLAVLHVLPYFVALGLVAGVTLWRNPSLLKRADYGLLITFVCFFIFSGNMGRIPFFQDLFSGFLNTAPVATAIVSSQVISNVPAAVLLSRFTGDGASLLIGTNLGGLGTLIASLASLISFQFYTAQPDAKPLRYLGAFTLFNLGFLAVLWLMTLL